MVKTVNCVLHIFYHNLNQLCTQTFYTSFSGFRFFKTTHHPNMHQGSFPKSLIPKMNRSKSQAFSSRMVTNKPPTQNQISQHPPEQTECSCLCFTNGLRLASADISFLGHWIEECQRLDSNLCSWVPDQGFQWFHFMWGQFLDSTFSSAHMTSLLCYLYGKAVGLMFIPGWLSGLGRLWPLGDSTWTAGLL